MRRLLAGLLLLASTAAAQEITWNAHIIDSKAHACDGQERVWYWKSTFPQDMAIVSVKQWVGMQGGLQADVDALSFVEHIGQGYPFLVWQQLDMYDGRHNQQERFIDFQPGWIRLRAGTHVFLRLICTPVYGTSGAVHASLQIAVRPLQ